MDDWFILVCMTQFMGDRVNAMRDYQQALKEDPTYALAYFNAGNVYFHMRQFKQVTAIMSAKDQEAFLWTGVNCSFLNLNQ